MKKYWKIILLLFVILTEMWVCTGCGDEKQTNNIPQTEQETQEDQTSEQPMSEETIQNTTVDQSSEQFMGEKPIQNETIDQLSATSTDMSPDKTTEVSQDNPTDTSTKESSNTPASEEAELSVVVESIEGNSVVGNKMFIESGVGGNSEIVLVGHGEDNKTLISVHFAENAAYVYCIIRDGGANVETREGSFSDIKVGLILDMDGRFEGEDFWADKVEIHDVRNN